MMKVNYKLVALVFVVFLVGAFHTNRSQAPSQRHNVYDISCEPTGTLDECVGHVGSVPLSILDTSDVCLRQSSIRCDQRYGKYGLALRDKEDIAGLDATSGLVYRLQKEGTRVFVPSLTVVEDVAYLLWIEIPYRIEADGLSRVMYMWRPVDGKTSDWSTPSVLFTNRNNTAQSYETAIQPETSGTDGAALHVAMYAAAEEGGSEILYARLREDSILTSSEVDIPYIAYPQIEVIGDSLYIAYTSTIGRRMPKLAKLRPRTRPDGNNLFFSSRHVDGGKWTSPRLVVDTGESEAHYVNTVSYEDILQIGYIEQHPDSSQDDYRQHTIRLGDAPETLDSLRYDITGSIQRMNSFQTIPEVPGVLILQWKGRPTEFHLLRPADTEPQTFRTELPELSATYYMNGNVPQVSYIGMKRHRPPVELEIRTIRFDP